MESAQVVEAMSVIDSSLTTVLFEVAVKIASLCQSKVFLIAENDGKRKFAGSRVLCEAYTTGRLRPFDPEAEVELRYDHLASRKGYEMGRSGELVIKRTSIYDLCSSAGGVQYEHDIGNRPEYVVATPKVPGGEELKNLNLKRKNIQSRSYDSNSEGDSETSTGSVSRNRRKEEAFQRKRIAETTETAGDDSCKQLSSATEHLASVTDTAEDWDDCDTDGLRLFPPLPPDDDKREDSASEDLISPFSGFSVDASFDSKSSSRRQVDVQASEEKSPSFRGADGNNNRKRKKKDDLKTRSRPSLPTPRNLFDRFMPPFPAEQQLVKSEFSLSEISQLQPAESGVSEREEEPGPKEVQFREEGSSAMSETEDKILSLTPSGRALVFSASRGLEEIEMKSDSVAEFFANHSKTIPKENTHALRLIAPEKIYEKGSSEYRLLTSSMSQLGRSIAEFCKDRGIENPQDPASKMLLNTLFDAWMRSELPHLHQTKIKPCDGRTSLGFLRHLTRVTFYCCFRRGRGGKQTAKKSGKAVPIEFPGFQ